MFDPRRIKIFQGVKRTVRENTTPHLRYINSRGTAVPQPLLVTVVFIVKGNPLLFSVANYKLYVVTEVIVQQVPYVVGIAKTVTEESFA